MPISVAAVQPTCVFGNVQANTEEHAAAIIAANARLVIFPELSLTGYDVRADPVDLSAFEPLRAACASAGTVALVGAVVEEKGRRFIATIRVAADAVTVVYRKSHLGGAEIGNFEPGDGPTVIDVDGYRVGLAICKDTGVAEHTVGTARLSVDLYAAGVVHAPEELDEQDRRGRLIAETCAAPVVLASAAGPVGPDYPATAGNSTVFAADGSKLARAGYSTGEIARVEVR